MALAWAGDLGGRKKEKDGRGARGALGRRVRDGHRGTLRCTREDDFGGSKEKGMFSDHGMLVGLAFASLPMAHVFRDPEGVHGRRVL
jgi:hypothetical protein